MNLELKGADFIMEKQINEKLIAAKKEVDRLTTRRSQDLGNSINYIENEIQIERLRGKIEAYEELLDL